jgi:hypothetical protein
MEDLHAGRNITSEIERNFARNKLMIDLSQIPQDLKTKILDEFNQENTKSRSKLMGYFIEKRLSNLLESIGDF